MSKKTFSWHFKNVQFFEKHIVTQEYLHKSFVRDTLTDNKDIKIVDNWSSVNDFFFKDQKSNSIKVFKYINKFEKQLIASKDNNALKLKTGSLIHLNYPILRHKFWDKIQLQVPMMPNAKPVDIIQLVKNFKKSSLNNKTKKRKLLPVQFLKPIKGGFTVRFSTIKGFLPRKDFILAKNALDKKCDKLNPINDFKATKYQKNFFDTNRFAHIFTHFKNPKLYLENRKEFILPYLNTLKLNDEKINIIKKYNILKGKTDYFRNFQMKKTSYKKNFVLNNISKIKLPLKFTNTRFTYHNKKAIFVKKRRLGKRRFFKRNFSINIKNNQKFHKLYSTVFFYKNYKHSSDFVFKPNFKKNFKFNKNFKKNNNYNKKNNFSKQNKNNL